MKISDHGVLVFEKRFAGYAIVKALGVFLAYFAVVDLSLYERSQQAQAKAYLDVKAEPT